MKKIFTSFLLIIGLLVLSACQSGITISFETNGGNEIADIKLTLDLDLNTLEEPSKTGYTFDGWFTDAELTEAFDPEVTITEDITLYAKWKAIVLTVSVSIDGVITTQSVNYGADAVLPVNPTKEGYTFTGWSSDGKNIKSDLTITASFLINAYTITFIAGEEEYTREVNHGGTLATEQIPVVPEVTGKNGAWDVTDFTNITSDLTVTAVYTDKMYTVTYVNKSGETVLGNATYGPFEVAHGTVMTAPNAADAITGYDFVSYDYNYSQPVTSNLTIIANYTKQSFIVTFKGLNGVVLKTQNVLYGNDATAPDYTAPEGYTLGGWSTAFTNVTANLTVQMGLNPISYDIVFNTGDGTPVATITAAYLSTITAPADPTLTDKAFQGWYLNAEGTGSPYIFTNETKMPLGGLILYAIWDNLSSYNVTVNRYLTKSTGTTPQSPVVYQVDYLEQFVPYTVIEGYDFVKLTIDGVDYFDESYVINVDSTVSVNVYYQIKTFTITFRQNPTGNLIVDQDFIVEYNSSFTSIPVLEPHSEGYDAMWDREVFENIQSDIIVGALYFSSTLKRVVFMDGSTIKYIAIQETETDTDIITNDSALMNLTKPGYIFLGWYDSPEFTNLIDFETYKYNSFEGISDTLYAKWEALDILGTPVIDDVTDTTITWHVPGVNGSYPLTFKLLLDGIESTITPTTSVQSGTITTYTYIATALDIAGTHTIKLMSLGIENESISSPYSATFTHVTEADPVDVVDEVIYDYFLIEKAGEQSTYIFYTDMVYNFAEKFTFTITEGGSRISANANKLTTNATTGTFSFDVFNSITNETKHYLGKVVTYINQFALGPNLTNYANAISEDNELFLSSQITPYLVGSKNNFHFDLRILDSKGVRVNQEDTSLTYQFYLWNGTSYQPLTTDLQDYLSITSDYQIDFKPFAEGRRFKVKIDPLYEATLVQSPTLEFEFEVNNGYNVFTDAELKTLFSDFNVQNINIHSTIYATLAQEQINKDGTPVNGYATPDQPGASNGKIYANPYIRMSKYVANDNLVINGNYFTINGSNLPYMTVESDPDGGFTDTGFDGSFDVVSVQVAMLYYNVYQWDSSVNDNQIAINNLTLVGNTSTPYINYSQSAEEILLAEQLMSRNSGGYVGITIRNGNAHIYNTNIGLMTIGLTTNAYGLTSNEDLVGVYVEYCTFYNEWANSIFGWASSLIDIKNSDIGLSGGAAIHVEDNRPGSGGAEDPRVVLDDATVINNWVSGQEAWFKAYGMTGAALALKTNADSGIAPMNKTIIRLIENPVTGLETEMFNFVLLTKSLDGANSTIGVENPVQVSGSEFQLVIPNANGTTSLIHQPFNFLLGPDPRVSANTFAFPVHPLIDTATFAATVEGLAIALQISPTDAANLVYLAAFHNLVPQQAAYLYGALQQTGGNWQLAYQELGLTGQGANEGRYMEISTQVPGLGPIIMITQYYARTAE